MLWEDLIEVDQDEFFAPTPIHARSWAIGLHSHSIVATAKPGYGETLGYLISGFIYPKQQCNDPKLGPNGYGNFIDYILIVSGQLTIQVISSCSPWADTLDGNQFSK